MKRVFFFKVISGFPVATFKDVGTSWEPQLEQADVSEEDILDIPVEGEKELDGLEQAISIVQELWDVNPEWTDVTYSHCITV